MNKEEALKKISESENAEFEVFAKEEHQTYLENYVKTKEPEIASEVTKRIHGEYDKTLTELFGTDRDPNEKTYNFLKRKYTDMKSGIDESEALRVKVKELEEAVKNSSGDEQLKSELASVRKEYDLIKDQFEVKEKEFNSTLESHKVSNELDKGMVGLKFKDDLPKEVVETYIEKVRDSLMSKAKIVDGKMIFTDAEGKTLVNQDNSLNPYTANEMLKKGLEPILASAKVDGPPKPEVIDKDGTKVVKLANPNAKTRAEVSEYLAKAGLSNGSKEYREMYAEFTKHLDPLK